MSSLKRHPEVDALLEILLARIREVLGDKLVGLYLYGSLVMGDFDMEASDIDLLAALTSDVTETEFERLQAMHDAIAREHPPWENRIEVQYYSLQGLNTFRDKRTPIAKISPGEPFNLSDAGRDWLMNWYMVREQAVVLYGPPAAEIIGPVSREEYVEAAREHVEEWGPRMAETKDRPSQAYAILTMCRALYTDREGGQLSKKQAAEWVAREYPEWAGITQKALAWRAAWREQGIDPEVTWPDTVRFVDFARRTILGR